MAESDTQMRRMERHGVYIDFSGFRSKDAKHPPPFSSRTEIQPNDYDYVGRPSMALDLIEEFRPIIVDSIVLMAVNRALIRLGDFTIRQSPDIEEESDQPTQNQPAAPAIYLSPEARKKFLGWYEERVNEQIYYPPAQERTTYRRIFSLQAQMMARVFLGQTGEYTSFTVK